MKVVYETTEGYKSVAYLDGFPLPDGVTYAGVNKYTDEDVCVRWLGPIEGWIEVTGWIRDPERDLP